MDFMIAVKTCINAKCATFSGRGLRFEIWFFTLFALLTSLIENVVCYGILGRCTEGIGPFSVIFSLAILVPSFAAARADRATSTVRVGGNLSSSSQSSVRYL
jgi:uncharacterized membrane protein YhaH (DUF805 family)